MLVPYTTNFNLNATSLIGTAPPPPPFVSNATQQAEAVAVDHPQTSQLSRRPTLSFDDTPVTARQRYEDVAGVNLNQGATNEEEDEEDGEWEEHELSDSSSDSFEIHVSDASLSQSVIEFEESSL